MHGRYREGMLMKIASAFVAVERSIIVFFCMAPLVVLAAPKPQPIPLPYPVHERYDAALAEIDATQSIRERKFILLAVGIPNKCEYLVRSNLYQKSGLNGW